MQMITWGRSLAAGLIAGLVSLAFMFWTRFYFEGPLIPELLAAKLFASIPIEVFSFFVRRLGLASKYVAFGTIVIGYLVFLLALGGLLLHGLRRLGAVFISSSAVVWIVSLGIFLLLGQPFPQTSYLFSAAILLFSSLIFGGALTALGLWFTPLPSLGKPGLEGRRAAIKMLSPALGLLLSGGLVALARAVWAQGGILFNRIKGLSWEVTPNDVFYTISKNVFDPRINPKNWSLKVTGLVDKELSLNLKDIKAMPAISQHTTLICISNEVGGDLVGNTLWKGVPLAEVLKRAGVKPGASELILRAYDGYSDSIPLAKGLEAGTTLAYEMNRAPLPDNHGRPLRLLVPGIYGMKNVKWITGVEVADYDYKGYWERRGWSDEAVIKTMSRIDVPQRGQRLKPGESYLAGIAFAGVRGVKRVQVSIDGGKSWSKTTVKKALSPFSWVLWAWPWNVARSLRGRLVTVKVRAMDGKGQLQTDRVTTPLPDGASGLHQVRVKLKKS